LEMGHRETGDVGQVGDAVGDAVAVFKHVARPQQALQRVFLARRVLAAAALQPGFQVGLAFVHGVQQGLQQQRGGAGAGTTGAAEANQQPADIARGRAPARVHQARPAPVAGPAGPPQGGRRGQAEQPAVAVAAQLQRAVAPAEHVAAAQADADEGGAGLDLAPQQHPDRTPAGRHVHGGAAFGQRQQPALGRGLGGQVQAASQADVAVADVSAGRQVHGRYSVDYFPVTEAREGPGRASGPNPGPVWRTNRRLHQRRQRFGQALWPNMAWPAHRRGNGPARVVAPPVTPAPMPLSFRKRPAWSWLLIGTLIAGSLDLTYAFTRAWLQWEVTPERVLQVIASGLQGRAAFEGGLASAALGASAHYLIMLGIAFGAAVLGGRRIATPRRAVVGGLLYGVLVFLVMTYVVVPLSRAPLKTPTSLLEVLPDLAAHMLLIGVTLMLAARRALARTWSGAGAF